MSKEKRSQDQVIDIERGELNHCMKADVMRKRWLKAGTFVTYLQTQYSLSHEEANKVNSALRIEINARASIINPSLLNEVEG